MLYAATKGLDMIDCTLGLVGESKVNTKWRIHEALKLVLLGELVRVVVQQLDILIVELDDVHVLLDPVRVDRFGQDCAAAGDYT